MEKPFFTEENELFFAELKSEKMSKVKLVLAFILTFSLMILSSPVGMFIFTLIIFLVPAVFHFLIFDFNLNIGLIMLGAHFVYYRFYFQAKYKRELLPEFYVMKESIQILKNRLKTTKKQY